MRKCSWLLRALIGGSLGWLVSLSPAAAQDVDAQVCADCHEEYVASASGGPHVALDRDPDLAARHGAAFSCAGCHGDPAEHLETGEAGTIFAFGEDTSPTQRADRCLTCHADTHPRFLASPHARSGLDCGSCHSVHGEQAGRPLLKASATTALFDLDTSSQTCAGCHQSELAAFEFNERHRLQEGIIACTDCHDPHAPATRLLLGGFKQQQCAQCHVDKSGPFVFEHGSVMVEGCVSCHEPHGAPSRHQLKFQRVAELCFSCHTVVPGFHSRFTAETVCTNCHSAIHGSNFHPAFLQ